MRAGRLFALRRRLSARGGIQLKVFRREQTSFISRLGYLVPSTLSAGNIVRSLDAFGGLAHMLLGWDDVGRTFFDRRVVR